VKLFEIGADDDSGSDPPPGRTNLMKAAGRKATTDRTPLPTGLHREHPGEERRLSRLSWGAEVAACAVRSDFAVNLIW
jgi:hypothetical protein